VKLFEFIEICAPGGYLAKTVAILSGLLHETSQTD